MKEISKCLAVGLDVFPFARLPIKVQGKGEQSTTGECNNSMTFLVRREVPGI